MVRFPKKNLVTAIADRIQGDGGFVQVNEITTGIGRTGEWFGFGHYNITPDIVSMGKGLGNGYPVSATAFNAPALSAMEACGFYHSQSHQNDPLGCAAALSVITTLKQEILIKRAKEQGAYLKAALNALALKYWQIKQVRGRGLMIALDFDNKIAHEAIVRLHLDLIQDGFIVAKRPGINTFRIDPPLTIEQEMLDNFIFALEKRLKKSELF